MDESHLTIKALPEELFLEIETRPVQERLRIIHASSDRNLGIFTLVVLGGRTVLREPTQEKLRCEINFFKCLILRTNVSNT